MVNLHRGAFAASASAWAFTTGLICSLHIASNGATLRITCKMQVTRKGNIAYVLLCCIIAAHSQHASHEPGPAIVCVHPPRSLVRAKFHARGPWSFHQSPWDAAAGFVGRGRRSNRRLSRCLLDLALLPQPRVGRWCAVAPRNAILAFRGL